MTEELEEALRDHGHSTREEYLIYLSETHGVELYEVEIIAEVLGDNELFDGLVTQLEDGY